MSITLGKNISALTVQRGLSKAESTLTQTFTRLSSGLRINTAADDAAGLSIALSLNAESRVYNQARRNLGDGVSMLTVADSAIQNLSEMITRIAELAEQSANGSVSDKQREAINQEAQSLSAEYTRIIRTAKFNGLTVLQGDGASVSLQAGYGAGGIISGTVGGSVGTGTFFNFSSTSAGISTRGTSLGDVNGDGIADMVSGSQDGGSAGIVTVSLGQADGTFQVGVSFQISDLNVSDVQLKDMNNDGVLDIVAGTQMNVGAGTIAVIMGNGNGSFKAAQSYSIAERQNRAIYVADINNDGYMDVISSGADLSTRSVSVRLGNGDGTLRSLVSYNATGAQSWDIEARDINGDGNLDLIDAGTGGIDVRFGDGSGAFGAATRYAMEDTSRGLTIIDVNNDGILDAVTAGQNAGQTQGYTTIRLGVGDGTFKAATSYTMDGNSSRSVAAYDLNGDGAVDIMTAGVDSGGLGMYSVRLGNSNGTFKAATTASTGHATSTYVTLGDVNHDGVMDALISSGNGGFTAFVQRTTAGTSPLLPFSLESRADSLQAMSQLRQAQENLSLQRSTIGAFQSRLSVANAELGSRVVNINQAYSTIMNADVAEEAAKLSSTQILQQAGVAVLGQANLNPSLALKLLGS